MGLFKKIFDDILGFNPPKPPPAPVIKQKQITEVIVIGPSVEQTVAAGGSSADGESIRVLADALVASQANREQGQAQLVNQILSFEGIRAQSRQASERIRAQSREASENLRALGQAQLVSELSSTSRAGISAFGRQASKVPQPAINQITGESSTTGMATMLGFLVVLAAVAFSKRRGR